MVFGVRSWQSNITVPSEILTVKNDESEGIKIKVSYKAERHEILVPKDSFFLGQNNEWIPVKNLKLNDQVKGLSGLTLLYFTINEIEEVDKQNFIKLETTQGSYLLNRIVVKNF